MDETVFDRITDELIDSFTDFVDYLETNKILPHKSKLGFKLVKEISQAENIEKVVFYSLDFLAILKVPLIYILIHIGLVFSFILIIYYNTNR